MTARGSQSSSPSLFRRVFEHEHEEEEDRPPLSSGRFHLVRPFRSARIVASLLGPLGATPDRLHHSYETDREQGQRTSIDRCQDQSPVVD